MAHNLEEQLHAAEIDVEFADLNEERLYKLVLLGEQARAFFDSDVGRYVIGAASQDLEDLGNKLRRVSPWRKRRIAQIQQDMDSVENGIRWIAETIQTANEAEEQLNQYRE